MTLVDLAALNAMRAERDAALARVLPPEVERGVVCFHGTPRACLSLRCGSNCSHRFDRMHPCPACLTAECHAALAENARLRAAVEGVLLRLQEASRAVAPSSWWSAWETRRQDAVASADAIRAALAAPTDDDGAERGAR